MLVMLLGMCPWAADTVVGDQQLMAPMLDPDGVMVGEPGWRGGWAYSGYYGPYPGYHAPPVVYAPPPVVTYAPPPQPMVLAAQPQPTVWYYCEASGKYFPYAQERPTGWQAQSATPPTSNAPQRRPQY
ncbi:hypothetical protein [Polynucleobacter necessarius]|uniref:hypothetical protein n=1 Tax=Polynucleobacter necessarius TaxID=576610 RepID=UPI000E09CFCE|nr:hypothetical protein [Polynucleobacter necessarius]